MKNLVLIIFHLLGFVILNAQTDVAKVSKSGYPVMTYKCPKGDALCDASGKCPLCGTELVPIKSSATVSNIKFENKDVVNTEDTRGIEALKKKDVDAQRVARRNTRGYTRG